MGIGDDIEEIGRTIKGGVSTVYHDTTNFIGHVGQSVQNVGSTVINDVNNRVKQVENTITLPLIFISVGIAFYLYNQNSQSLEKTSGNIVQGAKLAAI